MVRSESPLNAFRLRRGTQPCGSDHVCSLPNTDRATSRSSKIALASASRAVHNSNVFSAHYAAQALTTPSANRTDSRPYGVLFTTTCVVQSQTHLRWWPLACPIGVRALRSTHRGQRHGDAPTRRSRACRSLSRSRARSVITTMAAVDSRKRLESERHMDLSCPIAVALLNRCFVTWRVPSVTETAKTITASSAQHAEEPASCSH